MTTLILAAALAAQAPGILTPCPYRKPPLTPCTDVTLRTEFYEASSPDKPMFTIYADGRVAIRHGLSLDDASKCFWDAVEVQVNKPPPFPNRRACPFWSHMTEGQP